MRKVIPKRVTAGNNFRLSYLQFSHGRVEFLFKSLELHDRCYFMYAFIKPYQSIKLFMDNSISNLISSFLGVIIPRYGQIYQVRTVFQLIFFSRYHFSPNKVNYCNATVLSRDLSSQNVK